MSEPKRMTDAQVEDAMTRIDGLADMAHVTWADSELIGEVADELRAARASEAEKDATIKALADALAAAKVAMHRGEFGDKGRDRDVPAQVDAALTLAGRLP